jgi:hypothetical protein
MATVVETITWATYGAELKTFLGISGNSQDVLLEQLIAVASRQCDVYINQPFIEVDEDGEPTTDPPTDIVWITDPKHAGIKLGVYEWVKRYCELLELPVGAFTPGGIKSVKTKDLAETYGSVSGATSQTGLAALATQAVKGLWFPSRKKVWQ